MILGTTELDVPGIDVVPAVLGIDFFDGFPPKDTTSVYLGVHYLPNAQGSLVHLAAFHGGLSAVRGWDTTFLLAGAFPP